MSLNLTTSELFILISLGIGFLISYVLIILLLIRSPKKALQDAFSSELVGLDQTLEQRTRLSDRLLQELINELQTKLLSRSADLALQQQSALSQFKEEIQLGFTEHRQSFEKRHIESLQTLQTSLQKGLQFSADLIGQRVDKLTEQTEAKLKEISLQVDKRLNESFAKTTETFTDVLKRLALIDEAQKKITELSNNVVSLQDILRDKRSRGAFGEIQLSGLIRNMLPEKHFALQYKLSNDCRVDCILFLPKPTGNIAIDAKFPLESFQAMLKPEITEHEKTQAERQFKQDIRKHINDIANKYILPGETAEGAIMFIPAEAVFAEIHSHHPDLVELAQRSQVWLVSPSTLMAILTTARAVIKDEATQQQVNLIREHLRLLADDFNRFQARMDQLAKHIDQANHDVIQIHTSARKITARFQKIETVELENQNPVKDESLPETLLE